jgi:hypothetical protein
MCRYELQTFGALFLGLPDAKGRVAKHHLCVSCTKFVEALFERTRAQWVEDAEATFMTAVEARAAREALGFGDGPPHPPRDVSDP